MVNYKNFMVQNESNFSDFMLNFSENSREIRVFGAVLKLVDFQFTYLKEIEDLLNIIIE